MNPVTRQVQKTLVSPRRFGFVSLAVLAALLIYAYVVYPVVKNAATVIQYEDGSAVWATLVPEESVLCPGDTLTYTVTIGIESAPSFVDIREAWCVAGRQCPREFKLTPDFSIAAESGDLGKFAARRAVPDLPPGEWEFRHMNITTSQSEAHHKVTLSGYSLFITVPNDCAQ